MMRFRFDLRLPLVLGRWVSTKPTANMKLPAIDQSGWKNVGLRRNSANEFAGDRQGRYPAGTNTARADGTCGQAERSRHRA